MGGTHRSDGVAPVDRHRGVRLPPGTSRPASPAPPPAGRRGQAYAWLLEQRHPADWSRRTELVLPDEQAAKVDPLVGVHDELRLARLARQKQQGKSV